MANVVSTRDILRSYILKEYLPGEDPSELTDETPLITGGILNSIAVLKLITFLEEEFRIRLAPDEADVSYLDTIESMCGLIESKR